MALWRAVEVAAGDLDPFGPDFAVGLFDCWGAEPLKKIKTSKFLGLLTKFIINIVMAPWTIAKVAARLNGSSKLKSKKRNKNRI